MNSILKTMQGYEIWVLAEASHGHAGRPVAGRIYYGHAMHPDGLADLAQLKAFVTGPNQEKIEVSLREGKGDFHLAVFTPEQEGIWTLALENDAGPLVVTEDGLYKRGTRRDYPDAQKAAYYYQYAKTCIPVGHLDHAHGHGHCHQHSHHGHEGHSHSGCHQHEHTHCGHHHEEFSFLGHQLEIAASPVFCRKGQEVTLEVRYRGLPLPEADLCTTWSFYEKKDYPFQIKTDAAGRAKIPLRAEGHWLFYVRHEDNQTVNKKDYDQRVYSATFTIYGVR